MPTYRYTARDINGSKYEGIINAENEAIAKNALRQKGLFATSITIVREWNPLKRLKRISSKEIAILAQQFSILLDAGLPLVKSLTLLAQQNKNKKLKEVLNGVRQDIERGVSLAEALGKYPKVFSNLFINLIMVGEVGGTLTESLHQLNIYLEKEQQIKQQVKTALSYPRMVSFVCLAVIIFVLTFIVPRFASLYSSLGIKLPLPTIILMKSSKLILSYWWGVMCGFVVIYISYMRFRASGVGRWVIDRANLSMPIFGDLNRKSLASKFMRVLSSLMLSGVSIMRALEVAQQVVDNKVVGRVLEEARSKVSKGGRLEETISASKIFPDIVLSMVALGEETGDLSGSLAKGANYLEQELDGVVKRLISRVEPAMTILIAGIVGLLALAIYLPMFDIVKGITSH